MLSIHRSRWVTLLHQSKKSWNKRNPLSHKQPFSVTLPASPWSGWITNNKLRSQWQNTVKNGCPIPGYQIVKSKQTMSFRIVGSVWIWRFSTAFGTLKTIHCLQTDFPNSSGASTVVLGFFRQLTLSFSVIVDTSREKKLAIFLGGH